MAKQTQKKVNPPKNWVLVKESHNTKIFGSLFPHIRNIFEERASFSPLLKQRRYYPQPPLNDRSGPVVERFWPFWVSPPLKDPPLDDRPGVKMLHGVHLWVGWGYSSNICTHFHEDNSFKMAQGKGFEDTNNCVISSCPLFVIFLDQVVLKGGWKASNWYNPTNSRTQGSKNSWFHKVSNPL